MPGFIDGIKNGAKNIGKAIIETPKRVAQDLSEIDIPLVKGAKAAKEEFDKNGNVFDAVTKGVGETAKTNFNNTIQIGKALTEGSAFKVANEAAKNNK